MLCAGPAGHAPPFACKRGEPRGVQFHRMQQGLDWEGSFDGLRQQTIWDALLHRLQVEAPPEQPARRGRLPRLFCPFSGACGGEGLWARGACRAARRGGDGKRRGCLHRRAAPRGAAGPFPRGNGRVDKERKRNPKRRAVWRPKSRCTGENGGSGGRGEIFCRTTAHKNPKRLDF